MTSGWDRAEQLGAVVRRWDLSGAGRPLAVKELMAVRGVPTTASSPLDTDTPAERDSEPVRLLRVVGWEPVATTRSHEHAWGITTRTPDGRGARNPIDPTRVAGGSSGGSAIAVATGAVDLAVGGDTAGSVRIPAAWCGVLGLKVTHGSVSLEGCRPLAPSLDSAGLFARDLEVLRDGLRAWGIDVEPRAVRVASAVLPGAPALRHDLAAVIEGALSAAGVATQVELPDAPRVLDLFGVVQLTEALAAHRATWPAQRAAYGTDVASRLALAERVASPADLDAQRAEVRAEVLALFAGVDVMALPVSASGPSTVADPDHMDGVPLRDLVLPFTTPASLCGLPAMSVPVGRDADGLPVGIQLVAAPGRESDLLVAAAALRPRG